MQHRYLLTFCGVLIISQLVRGLEHQCRCKHITFLWSHIAAFCNCAPCTFVSSCLQLCILQMSGIISIYFVDSLHLFTVVLIIFGPHFTRGYLGDLVYCASLGGGFVSFWVFHSYMHCYLSLIPLLFCTLISHCPFRVSSSI